ncbi:MAG: DUF1257 domain-containing protein [bacterium JZ-2024 1]
MSHITTVKTKIRDLELLARAAERFGLSLVRAESFRAFTRSACEYKLTSGSSVEYEIGIVRSGDSYELLYDSWRGGYGLIERVGKNLERLISAYSEEVVSLEAVRSGLTVVSREESDDGIVLILEG